MPPFSNTWLPFIYLYGVGGLFFLTGMVIIRKAKAINFKRKRHRYWWRILIAGFIYFMVLHAFLILADLYL
jgi:hypothetical protein